MSEDGRRECFHCGGTGTATNGAREGECAECGGMGFFEPDETPKRQRPQFGTHQPDCKCSMCYHAAVKNLGIMEGERKARTVIATLQEKIAKLEETLKLAKESGRQSSVLVVQAHRREKALEQKLSDAELTIKRLRLWKR